MCVLERVLGGATGPATSPHLTSPAARIRFPKLNFVWTLGWQTQRGRSGILRLIIASFHRLNTMEGSPNNLFLFLFHFIHTKCLPRDPWSRRRRLLGTESNVVVARGPWGGNLLLAASSSRCGAAGSSWPPRMGPCPGVIVKGFRVILLGVPEVVRGIIGRLRKTVGSSK